MFFIGIFGIENKNKIISTKQNVICPVCNAFGRYDILKSYTFFHVFFIPLGQWNKRYYIQTHCCKRLCSLDKDVGQKIENGEPVEITQETIHCNDSIKNGHYCPRCSSQLDSSFRYCPNCGNRV